MTVVNLFVEIFTNCNQNPGIHLHEIHPPLHLHKCYKTVQNMLQDLRLIQLYNMQC